MLLPWTTQSLRAIEKKKPSWQQTSLGWVSLEYIPFCLESSFSSTRLVPWSSLLLWVGAACSSPEPRMLREQVPLTALSRAPLGPRVERMVTSVFGDSDSSSHYHMGSIPCEMLQKRNQPGSKHIIGAGVMRLCPLGFFVYGKT